MGGIAVGAVDVLEELVAFLLVKVAGVGGGLLGAFCQAASRPSASQVSCWPVGEPLLQVVLPLGARQSMSPAAS